MSSQKDVIELTSTQAETYRQLTCELTADTDVSHLSDLLLQCSTLRLDILRIQNIDCCLLQYSTSVLDKAAVFPESADVIETGSKLMLALAAYHHSLTVVNSQCSLQFCDVIGYLVLSGKLVHTLLTELVTADNPCQSVEEVKKLWDSLNTFIMKLIDLVNKYHSCDSYSSISSSIRELVLSLARISKELAAIDTKAMPLVYKCTLRLMNRDAEHRSNGVLATIVDCVCYTTHKLARVSPQQGPTRVVGFLLKILSKLVTFINVEASIRWTSVTDIILVVSASLTQCMYGVASTDGNLELALKSLLRVCIPHEQFQHSLMHEAHKACNLERVLYVISVIHESLASTPHTYKHWWTEEHMLSLSRLLSLCGNVLCQLHAKVYQKSAYEFVLARLAAMVVTVPAGLPFQHAERLLLTLLLSPHVHVNLLAADCWHFLARYSSDRVPYAHCCKLIDLLNDPRLTDRQVAAVQHVVHRLVGVMSPAVQVDLAKHSNAFNSGVLASATFHEQAQVHVERAAMASLKQHMASISNRRTAQVDLIFSLKSMARLLHTPFRLVDGEKVSLQAASLLMDVLTANLHNSSLDCCMCLAIGSYSSRRRLHPQLLKILHQLWPVFSNKSLGVQIKMATCLSDLCTLPTVQDQRLVVKLYTQCLSSNNFSLRLNSLQSFKLFAKSTPYQELISEIAAHSSEVNDRIVKYCSVQTDISELHLKSWNLSVSDWTAVVSKCSHEPATKRQRMDPEATICRLNEVVEEIKSAAAQFSNDQRKELGQLSSELSHIALGAS